MNRAYIGVIIMALQGFLNLNAQVLLPSAISKDTVLDPSSGYFYTGTSLSIPAGVTLKILEGVEIRMAAGSSIVVEGSLIGEGTQSNPIVIISTGSVKWNRINSISGSVHLSHTKILDAVQFIFANYGKIYLDHCYVDSTFGGVGADCIALHHVDSVTMLDCELHGDTLKSRIDAVDCDAAAYGTFKHNRIYNFEDDGIDIGSISSNITIDSNYLVNCNFGISVGEGSIAKADRNIITFCDGAMQTHTNAYIEANHNTFYKNLKGIECHHGSESSTPGDISIKNTIFSQTLDTLYTLQDGSDISITYCISDRGAFGIDSTNLFRDPRLVNPESGDFTLQSCSPCINTGDPSEQCNSCYLQADIGAWESPWSNADTVCSTTVGIPELIDEMHITLFPVPVQNELCVHSDAVMEGRVDIQVFNMNGRMVYSQPLSSFSECIPFDLPSGFYIVKLCDNNKRVLFRQLIAHYQVP
jgi:hypothetical protein